MTKVSPTAATGSLLASIDIPEPFAALMRAHQAPESILVEGYEPTARTEADEAFEATSGRAHYSRKPWPVGQGFLLCGFAPEQRGGEGGI